MTYDEAIESAAKDPAMARVLAEHRAALKRARDDEEIAAQLKEHFRALVEANART